MAEPDNTLVTLYSSADRDAVERLCAALSAALLDPVLETGGAELCVRLPAAQVARGAAVLASFDRPAVIPAGPSSWHKVWPPLLFVPLILAGTYGSVISNAKPPITAFFMAAMLISIFRSTRRLEEPNANRLTTYALVCAAVGYVPIQYIKSLGESVGPRYAFLALGPFAGVLFLASLVLGVAGLIRGYFYPERYGVGRGHGWWALILSGLVLFGGLSGYVNGRNASGAKPGEALPIQPPAETPLVDEGLNFQLPMPPPPWVKVDIKKLNKDATLGFTRADTDTSFIIIAEQSAGDLFPEGMMEAWRARMSSNDPGVQLVAPKKVTINGLEGLEGSATFKVGKLHLAAVNWSFESHGFVYQLLGYGRANAAAQVRAQTWELAKHFTVSDRKRVSPLIKPPRDPIARFESPNFGYTADLGGAPWMQMKELATDFPSAEFGAICGESTSVVVSPYPLLGHQAPGEALVRVLASRWGIGLDDADVVRAPLTRGNFKGEQLVVERVVQGRRFRYRLWAVADKTTGLLAVESQPVPADPPEEACLPVLERVALSAGRALPAAGVERRAEVAVFFTSLGNEHVRLGKPKPALAAVRQALALDPASLDAAWTLIDVAAKAGRGAEARKLLDSMLDKAPDNSPLLAVRASLLAGQNKPAPALADYARLFSSGYQEDETFAAWAHLLEKEGQRKRAFTELEKYRQHRDTTRIALLEAGMYSRQGETPKGIAVLEKRLATHQADEQVNLMLLNLHQSLDHDREAIDACERLAAQGRATTGVLIAKARSELALKWYPSAKRTLEAAAVREPENEEAKRLLEYVSNTLGEGENSSIKEPIEAVTLPAPLAAPAAAIPPGDHRAVYLLDATAISFVPGKDYRTTAYLKAKVLNPAGVELFSTLHFEFNPHWEGVYLNSLRVLDDQGTVVSTGSASDCYLSDQASEELGTARRTLYVPVPGLKPGHVVELTLTRKAFEAPQAIWYTRHFLSASLPTVQTSLFFRGDPATVRHRSAGGVSPRAVDNGLVWVVDGPLVYKPEPFDPPLEELAPVVWLGDAKATWETENAEYLKSLTPLLRPDPKVDALARKLTAGLKSREAKVTALGRFVQKEITYKAIEFGRGARVPRAPGDVLTHRYGDCKDHALLLKHLLAAVGVDARLALVRSWGHLAREVPSLDQFDHMILFIPGDTPVFIDATDKWADLTLGLPRWLSRQETLLVGPGPARFVRIGEGPSEAPPEITLEREVKLTAEGGADVQESVTLQGWSASSMRSLLNSVESDRRPAKLQAFLAGSSGTIRVRTVHTEELGDPEKPLKLKVKYLVDGQVREVGGDLVGKLPAPWEHNRVSTEAVEPRANPFSVRWPFSVKSTTTLSLPQDHELVPLKPQDSEARTAAFGRWSLAIEPARAAVEVRFAYQRSGGRHEAGAYGVFQRDVDQALSALEQPFMLKKRPAGR
ncbi:MAG: DUF3857 domain-containing protein [Myxococcaceae bacterium]